MKNSNKFAIIIDNEEKNVELKDILDELNFKPFFHEEQQSMVPAVRQVLLFDKKNNDTFKVMRNNSVLSRVFSEYFGGKTYKVSSDFDNMVEELYLLAGKENKRKKNNMVIDITISLPKQAPKPKRKVRVFANFVKVGFDAYAIKVDSFTGTEYVDIKGNRYYVVRDIFGKGYLVE